MATTCQCGRPPGCVHVLCRVATRSTKSPCCMAIGSGHDVRPLVVGGWSWCWLWWRRRRFIPHTTARPGVCRYRWLNYDRSPFGKQRACDCLDTTAEQDKRLGNSPRISSEEGGILERGNLPRCCVLLLLGCSAAWMATMDWSIV